MQPPNHNPHNPWRGGGGRGQRGRQGRRSWRNYGRAAWRRGWQRFDQHGWHGEDFRQWPPWKQRHQRPNPHHDYYAQPPEADFQPRRQVGYPERGQPANYPNEAFDEAFEQWSNWGSPHPGHQRYQAQPDFNNHPYRQQYRQRAYWRKWHARHHERRRHFLFFRLLTLFGLITLLLLGGLFVLGGLLVFVSHIPFYVWLFILGLGIGLSFVAWRLVLRAFRDFANPLTDLIEAAEAVANGNLNVRVAEKLPGDLGRLSQTFNRMLTELARADQLRRNLSADVAHELRTPIHILQGNIEGLLDGVYEPTPEHLNLLLDETRWLGRLVEDLRLLSLAEAGQLAFYKEPVALSDLLASVRQNFKGLAQNAHLNWQVLTETSATILGDAGRLEQALGNLTLNAIQHTPPGGKIRLWAEQDNQHAFLYVQDSGQGIDPEKVTYVFDRFWRGDAARTRTPNGSSGLGLAITRQLIESHGGTISVQSEPGNGTTFTIKLPLASRT